MGLYELFSFVWFADKAERLLRLLKKSHTTMLGARYRDFTIDSLPIWLQRLALS